MKILLLNFLLLIIMMLIGVAFLTLYERKILGYTQIRKGPNKLIMKGLTQSFSDALKLLSKEILMFNSNDYLYMISSMMMFIFSMLLWFIYPWLMNYLNYSILYLMVILSFNVYPIMFIGWSSNNNYSMLGSMRVIAQMISFEISLFILIFTVMMMIESFSLNQIFKFKMLMIYIFPVYLIMFISMLIELNRTPFDLIEGESELVSGFNIEYSSSLFTMIFLAEYSSIMFMGMFMTLMFFGVNLTQFLFWLIFMIHIYLIMLIRSILPRIRYDQMMYMCWTDFLMISLTYLLYMYLFKEIIMFF